MKRLLAALCALALLLSLSACGADGTKEAPETTTAAAQTAPPETKRVLAPPEIEGGRYRLDALQLAYTLGEGWQMLDQAGLAELNGLSAFPEDLREFLADSSQLLVGYAVGPESNGDLILQRLGPGELGLDAETLMRDNQETVADNLVSAGYDEVDMTLRKLSFCGRELPCSRIICSNGERELTLWQLFLLPENDDWAGILTLTASTEEIESLLAQFSAIE